VHHTDQYAKSLQWRPAVMFNVPNAKPHPGLRQSFGQELSCVPAMFSLRETSRRSRQQCSHNHCAKELPVCMCIRYHMKLAGGVSEYVHVHAAEQAGGGIPAPEPQLSTAAAGEAAQSLWSRCWGSWAAQHGVMPL
jgi:hypothetical protein